MRAIGHRSSAIGRRLSVRSAGVRIAAHERAWRNKDRQPMTDSR
jgi:hypothetical protein